MSGDQRAQMARDIVERRTGMPAYLASDEDWEAAEAEAQAADLPPERPRSALLDAVDRAQGRAPGQIEESIHFLNRVSAAMRSGGDQ